MQTSPSNLMLVPVEPQPHYIESSGRWCWPLPDRAHFPGCCTEVVTASREWWEYAPSEAKPHPLAEGVRLRDDVWYWAVPGTELNATPGATSAGEPSIPSEGSRPRELLTSKQKSRDSEGRAVNDKGIAFTDVLAAARRGEELDSIDVLEAQSWRIDNQKREIASLRKELLAARASRDETSDQRDAQRWRDLLASGFCLRCMTLHSGGMYHPTPDDPRDVTPLEPGHEQPMLKGPSGQLIGGRGRKP